MTCERCNDKMNRYTMSYFNTQLICTSCQEKEKSHPLYEKAREVERKQCELGNYNFSGIGLPEDLK